MTSSFFITRRVTDSEYTTPDELREFLRTYQLQGQGARFQAAYLSLADRDASHINAEITRIDDDVFMLNVASREGTWGNRAWRVQVRFSRDVNLPIERTGITRETMNGEADDVRLHVRSNTTGEWYRYEFGRLRRSLNDQPDNPDGARVWSELFAQEAWRAWRDVRFCDEILSLPLEEEDSIRGYSLSERKHGGNRYYEAFGFGCVVLANSGERESFHENQEEAREAIEQREMTEAIESTLGPDVDVEEPENEERTLRAENPKDWERELLGLWQLSKNPNTQKWIVWRLRDREAQPYGSEEYVYDDQEYGDENEARSRIHQLNQRILNLPAEYR